jgi:hypothetical protein
MTSTGGFRENIARVNCDGTLDIGFQQTQLGTDQRVFSLALQIDGKILIGGSFAYVNGLPSPYLARVWGTSPSYIQTIVRSNATSIMLGLRLPLGSTNRLQFKNDLLEAAWTDLPEDSFVSDSTNLIFKVDSTINQAQKRFYRVEGMRP